MVIGSDLNPNYRQAFLSDEAIGLAREHLHMVKIGTFLLKTGVFSYPNKTSFDKAKTEGPSCTQDIPAPTPTGYQSRVQKLINSKHTPTAGRFTFSNPRWGLSYDERVKKVDAKIRQQVSEMLGAWEHEEIIFSNDGWEIKNKEF